MFDERDFSYFLDGTTGLLITLLQLVSAVLLFIGYGLLASNNHRYQHTIGAGQLLAETS